MSDLHKRLLAKMDDEATGVNYWVNANPFEDAVRAVVDLCSEHQAEAADGGMCDADPLWPSEVLRVIARELGIAQ